MGSAVGLVVTSRRLPFPGLLLPVPPSLQQATAGPHLHRRPSNTGRQVWFSLLWGHCSFPLGLGAHRSCLCLPTVESVSPNPEEVLWSNPSGHQSCILCDSQSLYQIPRLRSLTWSSEPSWLWENSFGIMALQFVGHPPSKFEFLFYWDCASPTISLWLLPCVWTWGILFFWVPVSSCQWLFNS